MLCPVNKQPPHLGGYYFQQRTKGPSKYITALSPGRWERWRGGLGDGANRCPRAVDVADRCANDPPPPHVDWEQDLSLEPIFNLVLGRIRILTEGGLTSMMVLHDCVEAHRAPSGAYPPDVDLYRGE
jgi:hypothetical protein